MNTILHAALWAVGILCVALAGAFGLIPTSLANSLVTVLPLVMVAIIAGKRRNCRRADA